MKSVQQHSQNRSLKSIFPTVSVLADSASRIGVSIGTVHRLECGHSGTALTHRGSALKVFEELEKFRLLLDTPTDSVGLALMDAELPTWV